MRLDVLPTVVLLVCALILAPLSPAFAQATPATAPACTDMHAGHGAAAAGTPLGEHDAQHANCGGACCAACAHCFLATLALDVFAAPLGVSVYAAARHPGHSLRIPDLLERPPRLLA